MSSRFVLTKEETFYGFEFNYFLGKKSGREDYVAIDDRGVEFTPRMLRVNGQYFSDGSSWWEFTASGRGRMTVQERHQLSEDIPEGMPAWQKEFVKSALDRMQYETGTTGDIAKESLQKEKFLINTESYVGFQNIRTWKNTDDGTMLETDVSFDGTSLTTSYQKDGRRSTPGSETARIPNKGKNPDDALLWHREGYADIFSAQIDEVLAVAHSTPRTSLGFRKGKHAIKLTLRNRLVSILFQGIYKVVGLS